MSNYEIKNLWVEHFPTKESVLEMVLAIPSIERYYLIKHDQDVFPTGEYKKAHWHCYIECSSLSHHFKQDVQTNYLKNGTFLEVVRNMKSACRYLTHKDNKEKYQYTDSEVITNDIDTYTELVTLQLKEGKQEQVLKYCFQCIDKNIHIFKNCYTRQCDVQFQLHQLARQCYMKFSQLGYYTNHQKAIDMALYEYMLDLCDPSRQVVFELV